MVHFSTAFFTLLLVHFWAAVYILKDSDPAIDNQNIREQGLFADATAEKDSGILIGAINHKAQWKTEGYRIRKRIEVRLEA